MPKYKVDQESLVLKFQKYHISRCQVRVDLLETCDNPNPQLIEVSDLFRNFNFP